VNTYKGTVEIDDGNRVKFPIEVSASSWHVAAQRAARLGLKMYRKNRKGRKLLITGVEVYITCIRRENPKTLTGFLEK
jgi:hypothetical protein